MHRNLRQSGIMAVGQVPWGTHFCQFYETSQDLIETVVPYFKEGLAANELCMWITSMPLQVDQATVALKAAIPELDKYIEEGQIVILDGSQWHKSFGEFSADKMLRDLTKKSDAALEQGYEGLRLTANFFCLEQADWHNFRSCEQEIANFFGQHHLLAFCTYSLSKCGALEILDVIANHQFALVKRAGRWERIERACREKFEQAFERSEQCYRELVEKANSIILKYDSYGKITFFNEYAQKFFGYREDEVIGKDIGIILPAKESSGRILETLPQEIIEHPDDFMENTNENIRKNGEIVWISWRNKAILDGKGQVIGNLAVGQDVTKQKRAELALEDSKENLRLVADFTYDWESWLGPKGNYIYVSPSCERITGYNKEEFINNPSLTIDILHPDDRSTFVNYRKVHLNESAGAGQSDHRIITKSGEVRWISHYCQPIFGKNGQWLGRRESSRDITLRKETQDALADAAASSERERAQLEAVFAAQNDSLIIYDTDLKVTMANPSFLDAWGFDPIGFNFLDIARKVAIKRLDGKPFAGEQHPTSRAIHGEKVPGERYLVKRADGTWVAVEVSSSPIYEENRIIGAVAVWHDITENLRAVEELRRNEEILRGILDAAKESIWLFDAEGIVLMGNLIAMQRLGLPAQEVIGKHFGQIMNSDLAKARMERLRQVIQFGEPIQFEDEWGGIQFHNSFYPVADRTGLIYRVAAFSSDITERKKSEENLREMRDYLENLIDHANAPIIVWDPSYRITRFNHAFERLTGLRAYEVLSKPLDVLFPEDSKKESMIHIKRAISGERWDVVEIPILSKDGNTRTVLWNSANVYSKDGKTIVATTAQGQDITDRKQAELELRKSKEELSKSKEDLELKVRERTAELVKAKEAAEAAVRAKSEFMANMSHEIRTPMNAIIGMTSLLIDDETLSAEQKDFIETIRTSGDALMVIINDILDFSRIERERAVLEEQPFDLLSCIEESVDLVSGRATEKCLKLSSSIDESIPENIIGDPNRLRQILVILLDNAVKFTENGEVNLNVSGRQLNGKNEIHFAIQDTGIGISNEKMDRLFQPFSQVDASITREYGGTGLGLAIAKNLIGLMGGRIWVDSDFGSGSTFHFTIIAASASDNSEMRLIEVDPQLIGKNVLIVDGDKTNRCILGEYAYSWGMVPLIASNSQDALNWIKRGNIFSLAILGMDSLKTDGAKLAEEIRKIDKSIPMVAYSPISSQTNDDTFAAYLTNPLIPSQLHKILSGILSPKTDYFGGADLKTKIGQMHILLAEDNVSSQKVVRQMLKRLGCLVDVVANGIEALQALERQPYDLVLMDVRMPEMDGLEATRIIRQCRPDGEPKVIAVTAYALEGDREKCLAAGMDDYISKPVKMVELAAILKRFTKT